MPFPQHLGHESLGIGHVAKSVGLHREIEDTRIADKILDRFDAGNVLAIVLDLARDNRRGQ